jgi:CRISPR-associated protein Cas2
MSDARHIVATYDIVDDKRRLKVMKAMKNYGPRVQKSVFEFILETNRFQRLKDTCQKLIDPEEDSIRFYTVCAECRAKIEIMGWGVVAEDPESLVL